MNICTEITQEALLMTAEKKITCFLIFIIQFLNKDVLLLTTKNNFLKNYISQFSDNFN